MQRSWVVWFGSPMLKTARQIWAPRAQPTPAAIQRRNEITTVEPRARAELVNHKTVNHMKSASIVNENGVNRKLSWPGRAAVAEMTEPLPEGQLARRQLAKTAPITWYGICT